MERVRTNELDDLAPTRRSLLIRLRNYQDEKSWRDFFDTYWRLLYNVAIKAGLSDAEAQDAVQETVIEVMKKLPEFEYDQAKGSFKGWLLEMTSWRVNDQFRRRQRNIEHLRREPGTSTGTATVERLADPAGSELKAIWDQEWENNLRQVAIERTKRMVSAKDFQLFDLYVVRSWPASKVAATMRVNPVRVYMARHRVGRLMKREIDDLRREHSEIK